MRRWEQAEDRAFCLPNPINRYCVDRYNKAVNVLFLDLSIDTVDLPDLWKLKWHKEFKTSGLEESRIPEWMKK